MPLAGPPATRGDSGTTARDKTPRSRSASAWPGQVGAGLRVLRERGDPGAFEDPSSHPVRHPGRCRVRTSPGTRDCPASGEAVAAVASADDPDVLRLGSLLALRDAGLDLLPFLQAAVAAAGDRAEVHEHVRATLGRDESVALLAVEPLHRALRHLDLLRPDAAPRHGGGDRASRNSL